MTCFESSRETYIHKFHIKFFFHPTRRQIQNRKAWLDLFWLIERFQAKIFINSEP